MLSSYTELLRQPGTLRFSSAALIGRFPISAVGLSIVLLVAGKTGSYGVAGAVSATSVMAGAIISPFGSRLSDRYGQSRMIPILTAIECIALAALLFAVDRDLPRVIWFLAAGVAGGAAPSFGSMARARWAHTLGDDPGLRTAFALESVLDELVFVIGPPLATIVGVAAGPEVPVLACIALLITGAVLLTPQHATDPGPQERHRDGTPHRPVILIRGIPAVLGVFVLLGGLFGSVEVTAVAFTRELGSPGAAGIALGIWSASSLIAGVIFGAKLSGHRLLPTFFVTIGFLAVAVLPFPWVGSIAVLSVCLFVSGIAVSPSMITGFTLVEQLTPRETLTEALTIAIAAISVGVAAGAALAGALIDARGGSAGFLVATASGVGSLLILLATRGTLAHADGEATGTAPR